MNSPTPGPWIVVENTRERTIQIDTANHHGTVVGPGAISWLPDAPLLAAAPEMLEMLLTMIRCFEYPEMSRAERAVMMAARTLVAHIEGDV